MKVRAQLAADPRCVAEARRLTWSTLEEWGLAPLSEIAGLLVSELTTNAILHAHSPIGIVLESDPDGLRVSVCDDSPAPPRMRRFSAEAATGRGIRLLQSLSNAWGVNLCADGGKCVWFTLQPGGIQRIEMWDFDASGVEPL